VSGPKPRKERSGEWVVMIASSRGERGFASQCQRCMAILDMALPLDLSVMVAASRAFVKAHKQCEKRAVCDG